MSHQQRFIRRLNSGVGGADTLKPFIDPFTLPGMQLILDARNIVGVADGGAVATWPDTSGFGRNAAAVAAPIYRKVGSVGGQPVVDFNGGRQMNGPLPVVAMDVTQGFTCYAYYLDDTVDANDGGGVNAQNIGGCEFGNGFRHWAVVYQFANAPTPAGDLFGARFYDGQAQTGRHILTVVVDPPGQPAAARLFLDSALVASGTSPAGFGPNTGYVVSGNSVQNVTLKGKVGWFGFANQAHGTRTRLGVENFLLRAFG